VLDRVFVVLEVSRNNGVWLGGHVEVDDAEDSRDSSDGSVLSQHLAFKTLGAKQLGRNDPHVHQSLVGGNLASASQLVFEPGGRAIVLRGSLRAAAVLPNVGDEWLGAREDASRWLEGCAEDGGAESWHCDCSEVVEG
jgi:hypothetical protein